MIGLRKKGEGRKRKKERRVGGGGQNLTPGRVTCLFRVVEQIYIALSSPPVIPLSRCCCRTLDSAHRREMKGVEGRGRGKTRGEKRKMEGRKNEKYRILKYRRPRRGEMSRALCMHCARERAFISPLALVFAEDYPRCVVAARAAHRLFSVPRCAASRRRIKPTCPR